MRVRIRFVAGLSGLLLCSATACGADGSAAASAVPVADPAVLVDAVRVALERELEGHDVDRNSLLLHVLEQDPEFAPAHWHLGHLKVNNDK